MPSPLRRCYVFLKYATRCHCAILIRFFMEKTVHQQGADDRLLSPHLLNADSHVEITLATKI